MESIILIVFILMIWVLVIGFSIEYVRKVAPQIGENKTVWTIIACFAPLLAVIILALIKRKTGKG